jgi:hypothetical protein
MDVQTSWSKIAHVEGTNHAKRARVGVGRRGTRQHLAWQRKQVEGRRHPGPWPPGATSSVPSRCPSWAPTSSSPAMAPHHDLWVEVELRHGNPPSLQACRRGPTDWRPWSPSRRSLGEAWCAPLLPNLVLISSTRPRRRAGQGWGAVWIDGGRRRRGGGTVGIDARWLGEEEASGLEHEEWGDWERSRPGTSAWGKLQSTLRVEIFSMGWWHARPNQIPPIVTDEWTRPKVGPIRS